MSDLYLVLRSRLDSVQEWVTVGKEVMEKARRARGLSYEAVARQIPCSSKTYERYEKAGRIPRQSIEKFALVLGLEIEQPNHGGKIKLAERGTSAQVEDAAALLVAAATSLQQVAARLEKKLDELEQRPVPSRARVVRQRKR